jgi:hypothetical protein
MAPGASTSGQISIQHIKERHPACFFTADFKFKTLQVIHIIDSNVASSIATPHSQSGAVVLLWHAGQLMRAGKPCVPEKMIGTLTLSILKSIYTSIPPIMFYTFIFCGRSRIS